MGARLPSPHGPRPSAYRLSVGLATTVWLALMGACLPAYEKGYPDDDKGAGGAAGARWDTNPLPDLEPNGWNVSRSMRGLGLYLCLNRNSDGTSSSDGDYVRVTNNGNRSAASGYGVGLGVQNTASSSVYILAGRLRATESQEPGDSLRWDGPFCASADTSSLPSGTYRVVVKADVDESVVESDEINNLSHGKNTFSVTRGSANSLQGVVVEMGNVGDEPAP